MRQYQGFELLVEQNARFRRDELANRLLKDLQHCECQILGCINDNQNILLCNLSLVAGSLSYEKFDHRIDLMLAGQILNNDCVPLTYKLTGETVSISGRCSIIPRVCGVDLYLSRSYTGRVGDLVTQRFTLDLNQLSQT